MNFCKDGLISIQDMHVVWDLHFMLLRLSIIEELPYWANLPKTDTTHFELKLKDEYVLAKK
jgi:hypothetical protein